MNGLGILGTIVLVFLAVLVGIPVLAALGGIVVAVLAAGLAISVGVGVLGAVFSLFGLLFRISFGIGGVFVTLLSGALMIGIAGVIASHLLPLLLLGALIWFVVKQSKPAQPPRALAAS